MPRVVRRLLAWLLPWEHREVILGDLEEEWISRRERGTSRSAAGFLYLIDAGRSILRLQVEAIRSVAVGQVGEFRRAARAIRRRPATGLGIVCSLALGIGSSTAAFTLVEGVLFRPLPFPDPDELVRVVARNAGSGDVEEELSFPLIRELTQADVPLRTAAVGRVRLVVAGDAGATRLRAETVTAPYFEILGLEAHRGRLPSGDSRAPEIAISHRLWTSRYETDAGIVGRTERTANATYRIVGVLPPGFLGTTEEDVVDAWILLGTWAQLETDDGGAERLENPDRSWLRTVSRMDGSFEPEAVEAALEPTARSASRLGPENQAFSLHVRPLDQRWKNSARAGLLLLLGGTLGVLLIGAFNAVSLLLVRLAQRTPELALRRALGGRTGHLLRSISSEAILLAAAGGLAGLVLSPALVDLLSGLVLTSLDDVTLPGWVQVEVSGPAVLFSLVATLGVVGAATVAPALRLPALFEAGAMKGKTAGPSTSGPRAAEAFAVAEIATATLLLVTAGLLFRSYLHLRDVDPGYAVERLAKVQVTADGPAYQTASARLEYHARVVEAVRSTPGVEAAGIVAPSLPPLSLWTVDLSVEGSQDEGAETLTVDYHLVGPGVLELMQIALLHGRTLTETDEGEAVRAAVVSETLANRIAPGGHAVGRRFRVAAPVEDSEWFNVIGVVEDVAWEGPRAAGAPLDLYVPLAYAPPGFFGVVARTGVRAEEVLPAIRRNVGRLDPEVPVHWVETMEASISGEAAGLERQSWAIIAYAGIAGLMAVVGVYSILSHAVSRRLMEFGVRVALGATGRNVAGEILRRGTLLVLVGIVAGMAGAGVVGTVLEATLYGVTSSDPVTLGAAAAVVGLAGIVAAGVPALRAARSDPVDLLKVG